MNGRGVNPSIWIRPRGLLAIACLQLKLSSAGRRGLRSGMEGPRRHISGARGRGGLPACLPAQRTSLGTPRAHLVCNWSVSQAHLLACDMSGEKPNKHVGIS